MSNLACRSLIRFLSRQSTPTGAALARPSRRCTNSSPRSSHVRPRWLFARSTRSSKLQSRSRMAYLRMCFLLPFHSSRSPASSLRVSAQRGQDAAADGCTHAMTACRPSSSSSIRTRSRAFAAPTRHSSLQRCAGSPPRLTVQLLHQQRRHHRRRPVSAQQQEQAAQRQGHRARGAAWRPCRAATRT